MPIRTNKKRTEPSDVIFLIPSCKKYSQKAQAIKESWIQELKEYGYRYLFLIGNPEQESSLILEETLIVPCRDDYESLLLKLVLAYKFLYENRNFSFVYKIDDDCYPNIKKLTDEILPQLSNHQYLGGAIHKKGASMNNKWHYGKCSSSKFDIPFKYNVAPFSFAKGGYGYFLQYDILPLLFQWIPQLSQEIEQGIYSYEDVRIAEILTQHNIVVTPLKRYKVAKFTHNSSFNKNIYLYYDIAKPEYFSEIERLKRTKKRGIDFKKIFSFSQKKELHAKK